MINAFLLIFMKNIGFKMQMRSVGYVEPIEVTMFFSESCEIIVAKN